jgi:hypothetical protein
VNHSSVGTLAGSLVLLLLVIHILHVVPLNENGKKTHTPFENIVSPGKKHIVSMVGAQSVYYRRLFNAIRWCL